MVLGSTARAVCFYPQLCQALLHESLCIEGCRSSSTCRWRRASHRSCLLDWCVFMVFMAIQQDQSQVCYASRWLRHFLVHVSGGNPAAHRTHLWPRRTSATAEVIWRTPLCVAARSTSRRQRRATSAARIGLSGWIYVMMIIRQGSSWYWWLYCSPWRWQRSLSCHGSRWRRLRWRSAGAVLCLNCSAGSGSWNCWECLSSFVIHSFSQVTSLWIVDVQLDVFEQRSTSLDRPQTQGWNNLDLYLDDAHHLIIRQSWKRHLLRSCEWTSQNLWSPNLSMLFGGLSSFIPWSFWLASWISSFSFSYPCLVDPSRGYWCSHNRNW